MKGNWIKNMVNKIGDFTLNLKEAWDNIKLLKEGFQSHYHEKKSMKFRNEQGKIAISDTENVRLADEHFTKVFNRDAEVDMDYIHQTPRKATLFELANSISFVEFIQAVDKLTWHKSPGINGVSPNMIKTLDDENKYVLYLFIKDWMEDNTITYEQ